MRHLLIAALLLWLLVGCAEEDALIFEPTHVPRGYHGTAARVECDQGTQELCFTFPADSKFDHCIPAKALSSGAFTWLGCTLEEDGHAHGRPSRLVHRTDQQPFISCVY